MDVQRINQPSQYRQYRRIFVKFMSFVDGIQYQDEQQFTAEQLRQIAPVHVYRYLCKRAYGSPDPRPDDLPTAARSSTLEYDKKAISFFMPNRKRDWDDNSQTGNPTHSDLVNALFSVIRKKEVRKQG